MHINTYNIVDVCSLHLECVKLLLEDKRCTPSFVNKRDDSGCSAIFFALKNSDLPIIQLFVDYPDIEVNTGNDQDMSRILYAAKNRPEAVSLLLSNPNTMLIDLD